MADVCDVVPAGHLDCDHHGGGLGRGGHYRHLRSNLAFLLNVGLHIFQNHFVRRTVLVGKDDHLYLASSARFSAQALGSAYAGHLFRPINKVVPVPTGDGPPDLLQHSAAEGVISLSLRTAAEWRGVGNGGHASNGHTQGCDGADGHIPHGARRLALSSHFTVAFRVDLCRCSGFKDQCAIQDLCAQRDGRTRLPGKKQIAYRRCGGVPGFIVVQGLPVKVLALGGIQQYMVGDGLYFHRVHTGHLFGNSLQVIHAEAALQLVGWIFQAVPHALKDGVCAEVYRCVAHAALTSLASHSTVIAP